MDLVVYLALGVLIVVFGVSLLILILMCRRRSVALKYLTFSPSQRFSKLQNHESIEGIAQLSPLIAAALDKNSWVYDVSGLLQHCVALLRLCHTLSDKLSRIPLYPELQHIRSHPPLNTVLCEATQKVIPAFDDLLSSVASPNVDVRVLEARAQSLAIICWGLILPFVLINPKVNEFLDFPMKEMETHLIALRQAAELAEKAEMGKLTMDWNALAKRADEEESDGEVDADDDGETETKIETIPLVDRTESAVDNKEEIR